MRRGNERGAAAIIFAVVLPILLIMVAFVVDYGYAYYSKQRLQDSLDLAAIAAARQLDGATDQRGRARSAAVAVLVQNDYTGDSLSGVEFGSYQRSRGVLDRFVVESSTSSSAPTAVRLTATDPSPRFFSRILAQDSLDVGARSTAVTTGRYATVRIGSGLASLGPGLLNGILGLLLGSSVNLTALDYNGLVGANIDLLGLLDQYAVKVGLQVGNYDQLLGADVSALGILGVVADVAKNAANGDPAALGLGIGLGDAFPGISKLPLLNLHDVNVKLGDLLGVAAGTNQNGLAVPINVFDLVTAALFAASPAASNATGQHPVALSLGTFLGASLDLSVVEQMQPPSGQRVITDDDIKNGDNLLRTAQIRLLLQVDLTGPLGSVVSLVNGLLGILNLLGVSIQLLPDGNNLSVGVDVAPAQAVVTKLGCEPANTADRYVAMNIDTGLLGAFIGQIDKTAFLSNDIAAHADPLTLLSVKLFGIPLLGAGIGVNLPVGAPTLAAEVKGGDATSKKAFPDLYALFSQTGQAPDNADFPSSIHTGTSQILTTLVSQLVGSLGLSLTGVLGDVLSAILNPVLSLLTTILSVTLTPILDALVDLLLNTLGLSVGTADVAVINLECNNAKLVP
ncbi:pilus assembly protein TadG-related protein [Zavarzinia sp.]|uniref:pilus assembly protein TadG-related protein n=1 Tax=Zavarzinia sp. TaxID=2027920 RepID=UPI003568E5D2